MQIGLSPPSRFSTVEEEDWMKGGSNGGGDMGHAVKQTRQEKVLAHLPIVAFHKENNI